MCCEAGSRVRILLSGTSFLPLFALISDDIVRTRSSYFRITYAPVTSATGLRIPAADGPVLTGLRVAQ